MTRDEIMAMQPGPELDNEIAVKLFGVDPDELDAVNIFGGRRLPRYSQSWYGMQLVVEAMKKRGLDLQLLSRNDWTARFWLFAGDGTGYSECRDTTAPAAVAIAALLALEGEHA